LKHKYVTGFRVRDINGIIANGVPYSRAYTNGIPKSGADDAW